MACTLHFKPISGNPALSGAITVSAIANMGGGAGGGEGGSGNSGNSGNNDNSNNGGSGGGGGGGGGGENSDALVAVVYEVRRDNQMLRRQNRKLRAALGTLIGFLV